MEQNIIGFQELNEKQRKEFEELAEEYVSILHRINNFITVNNADYDEIWDEANKAYDIDLTYAPNDEE